MSNVNVERLLFIDTETNPDTQVVECVTWLIGDKKGIIEEFNIQTFHFLKNLWSRADGICMFNAPFDLGVLSVAWEQNGFKWDITMMGDEPMSNWLMMLFGQNYKVKKIGFTRNFIKPMSSKYGAPVIDLLKLWEILIEQTDISLKSLIKRHLKKEPIPWSVDNARTEAYRYQDVVDLKELFEIFLVKIEAIEGLEDYTSEDWGDIKTPATFTKKAYANEFVGLKDYKDHNVEINDKFVLKSAFEKAYHGGLTFAFYRGFVKNTAWVDISGAYSKAIEILNTDSYLKYDIEEVSDFDYKNPYLLKVKSNFVLIEINGGLKTFYIKNPHENWVWNFDIAAINNLISDYKYDILKIYKIIPLLDVKTSLPVKWNDKKNFEKEVNGKTTLYQFYKFMSNTSYGIKAQRKPFETIHTNMAIAGMITARVHWVLTTINRTLIDEGFPVIYNDTDSACFTFIPDENGRPFDSVIIDKINKAISPFEVDCEGIYDESIILSLKRYVSFDADLYTDMNIELLGGIPKDKVRMHGKSVYDISVNKMREYTIYQKLKSDRLLNIKQFVGNTERGLKRIVSLFPNLKGEIRPFMFIKDVPSDKLESEFMRDWREHIDTKLTYKSGEQKSFVRTFRKFRDVLHATTVYKNELKKRTKPVYGEGADMTNHFVHWDVYEHDLSPEHIKQIDKAKLDIKKPKPYFDLKSSKLVLKPVPKSKSAPKPASKSKSAPKPASKSKTKFKQCRICYAPLNIGVNISKSKFKNSDYICDVCYNKNRRK